mmetsp:Transcript_31384/g.42837  ORF Transcript_31384/g.42837 Transcript_31384/m.42837 type:complete len:206 (-) Transcript_31384:496-1113(-)
MRLIPKYTKLALFTLRLSYFQTATSLCTPSRDTLSITYSCPARNSCTNTTSFSSPSPFTFPRIRLNAVSASSRVWHRNTSSVPALSTGFTTHLNGPRSSPAGKSSVAKKYFISSMVWHMHWRTARTPACRTVSPMWNLFLRARDCWMPLLRSLSRHDNWSANSTPVSAPGRTATILNGKSKSVRVVSSIATSRSFLVLLCCTVAQ